MDRDWSDESCVKVFSANGCIWRLSNSDIRELVIDDVSVGAYVVGLSNGLAK
jgi:hypothetical protein